MLAEQAEPEVGCLHSITEQDRNQLILDNLSRVRWIAARIQRRLPAAVSAEDLISVGVLGLIEAVDRFDPTFNVKLSTFVEHRIRGAILDSICDLDGVPAHKRAKAKAFEKAVRSAEQRISGRPLAEDIAKELGISLSDYHEWVTDIRGVSVDSLWKVYDRGGAEVTLADTIADPCQAPPDCRLEREQLLVLIQKGLDSLPVMQKKVLTLHFLEGWRLREIAAVSNLHVTRISQIKTQATVRLRRFVQQRWQVRHVQRGGLCA